MPQSKSYLLLPLALSMGFVLAGVAVIGCNLQSSATAAATTNWPTIDATITLSDVREEITVSKRRASQGCWVTARFEYEVDGKKYEGDHISYSGDLPAADMKHAKSLAAKYTPGQVVPAYYNPADPGFAILEPGDNEVIVNWIMRGAGGILVLIGVFFLGWIAYRFVTPSTE